MDNKTLKAMVIELKDSGLTYQEISDRLDTEYGVKRSRQSLRGLYIRGIRDNTTEKQKIRFRAKADVVNIYCLGYTMKQVLEEVVKMDFDINYNDVVIIIREESEYIQDVEKSIVAKLDSSIDNLKNLDEAKNLIVYKNLEVTDKKLKEYISKVYKERILNNINEYLNDAVAFTDDKDVAKIICNELGLEKRILSK